MMYAGKRPSVSRRVGATLIFISVCRRLQSSSPLCVRFVSFGMSSCSLPWFIAPAFPTTLPAGYQPAFDHACTWAGWFHVYCICSNRLCMDAGVVFILFSLIHLPFPLQKYWLIQYFACSQTGWSCQSLPHPASNPKYRSRHRRGH